MDFRGDLGEDDIDARVSVVSDGRHQGARAMCPVYVISWALGLFSARCLVLCVCGQAGEG